MIVANISVQANFEALETVRLTVTRSGTGSGSVSNGSSIACGTTCTRTYVPGTQITLTVAPDAESAFSGWTGGCNATDASCTFAINADTTVDAAFIRANLALEAASEGLVMFNPFYGLFARWPGGTINGTSSIATPTTISCAMPLTVETSGGGFDLPDKVVRCLFALPEGAVVDLVATPNFLGVFDAWSGCDAPGTDPMTAAPTCGNVQTSFATIPTVRARFKARR